MITVKQALESDIPLIEEILLEAAEYLFSIGQPQWDRKNLTWQVISRCFKAEDFYIAYIDGETAGCMAVVDFDPAFWPELKKGQSLFIHKLAVKRFAAKRGASKALLDCAKNMAIKKGVGELRLDCHRSREKVRALYEKEGFVPVGEKTFFGGGYNAALYVWKAG